MAVNMTDFRKLHKSLITSITTKLNFAVHLNIQLWMKSLCSMAEVFSNNIPN